MVRRIAVAPARLGTSVPKIMVDRLGPRAAVDLRTTVGPPGATWRITIARPARTVRRITLAPARLHTSVPKIVADRLRPPATSILRTEVARP